MGYQSFPTSGKAEVVMSTDFTAPPNRLSKHSRLDRMQASALQPGQREVARLKARTRFMRVKTFASCILVHQSCLQRSRMSLQQTNPSDFNELGVITAMPSQIGKVMHLPDSLIITSHKKPGMMEHCAIGCR
jgi:hypothetical protein